MPFKQMPDPQLDLIKDFEATGMAKPLEKPKAPRKAPSTVADRVLAELYEKTDAAQKIMSEKKKVMASISIKGIMDEFKKMKEKEHLAASQNESQNESQKESQNEGDNSDEDDNNK